MAGQRRFQCCKDFGRIRRKAPGADKELSQGLSPRRHRTGRTQQFNARTTPETVAGFYEIADQQRWLVGETLEHALAALRRELEGQGKG
jgi:hypothetical protein